MPHRIVWLVLVVLALCPDALAQKDPRQEEPQDVPVIRFTPEMARALAGTYTRQVLVKRYELDPARTDEAKEAIARRFMATAQEVQSDGAEFMEYMVSQIMSAQARGEPGMTPEMGKGVAERLLPMVPVVRDLVRDVSSDVRPMLSLKNQFKLTADMALAGTAINAFEQNMQRWSKGGARPFEDPFRSDDQQAVQREADGLSKEAKQAKKNAQNNVDVGSWNQWKKYVEDARKLYGFDDSQIAAAESILREYTTRAQTASQDAAWHDQMYRNRMWWWMLMNMHQGWGHLLWSRLDDQQKELNDPISRLETEFKTRIDEIPTSAQRAAADSRMAALLADNGFTTTEPAP